MFHHFRYLENLDRLDVWPSRRIVVDRINPFKALSEEEFLCRYSLNKECANNVIQQIQDALAHEVDSRGTFLYINDDTL